MRPALRIVALTAATLLSSGAGTAAPRSPRLHGRVMIVDGLETALPAVHVFQ
jgi:hypothetical protein